MKTKVEESFSQFYEKWVSQLEELLQQMLQLLSRCHVVQVCVGDPAAAEAQALVSRATAHVKAYYTAKWAAAHDDVLAFYGPVWTSPLENACQWVTGWKPSMAFRLAVGLAALALSEVQAKHVEELRAKIRLEEEKVEREMERQQVAVADRRMLELARLAACGGGEVAAVEVTVRGMLVGLERVMKAADCVRLKTLKWLLEELSPLQCVEFLAATCMLQLQLRHFGMRSFSVTNANANVNNVNDNSNGPKL